MENLSKEEIVYNLAKQVRDNDIQSFEDFTKEIKEDVEMSDFLFGAMEQYASQQTAALEKEVEKLRTGLKEIMQTVQKYNSFSGETGCGNHCYNIANEILIG